MKFLEETLFRSFYLHKRHLSVYRILYCLIIALFTGLPSCTWLNNEFNYVFAPPILSFDSFFTNFPSNGFFKTVSLVNVISFFLMFWGVRTKAASMLFTATCILGNSFVFSFGKIDHGILWIVVPFFLGLADWGRYYSIDSMQRPIKAIQTPADERASVSFILSVFALIIGFSFFTAGLLKVYGEWWRWDALAVKNNLYRHCYFLGRDKYLASYFLSINNHVFWKAMDYATLVFEVGFLFSVLRLQVFWWFVAVAAVFHLWVLLMFNISFIGNLLVYLLLVDWERLIALVRRSFRRTGIYKKNASIALFGLALFMLPYWLWKLFSAKSVFHFDSLLSLLLHAWQVPDAKTISDNALFLLLIPFLLLVLISRFTYKPGLVPA